VSNKIINTSRGPIKKEGDEKTILTDERGILEEIKEFTEAKFGGEDINIRT